MSLSTHILDAGLGRPARGVTVKLEHRDGSGWIARGESRTDEDGRIRTGLEADIPGVYRLIFDTEGYFFSLGVTSFYPEVVVTFTVERTDDHYHVPLLLSPWAYSTYRGS